MWQEIRKRRVVTSLKVLLRLFWKSPSPYNGHFFARWGGIGKLYFRKKKTACLSKRWSAWICCNGLALRSGITTLGGKGKGIWKHRGRRTAPPPSNTVLVLEVSDRRWFAHKSGTSPNGKLEGLWFWWPLHTFFSLIVYGHESMLFFQFFRNFLKKFDLMGIFSCCSGNLLASSIVMMGSGNTTPSSRQTKGL